jgi:hypothetical protein
MTLLSLILILFIGDLQGVGYITPQIYHLIASFECYVRSPILIYPEVDRLEQLFSDRFPFDNLNSRAVIPMLDTVRQDRHRDQLVFE